jgi:hypothetical protein
MAGKKCLLVATTCFAWLLLAPRGTALEPAPPPVPSSADLILGGKEALLRTLEKDERESRFEDHIETDRDAFTPTTKTVELGRLIVESSYSFEDNRATPETHSFPELLLRYGLAERIELRMGWNYEVGGVSSAVTGADVVESPGGTGLPHDSHLLYGLKLRVSKQEDWLPDSSLIVQGLTPTSGESTATQLNAAYAFGWKFPNRWRLDSALRFETDSENGDRFQIWAPSVVLRVPIGERWQVHAEYFGLFSEGKAEPFSRNFFSPGAHFLITPNWEIGVRVGWGLNDQASRFFSNVGFGCRF